MRIKSERKNDQEMRGVDAHENRSHIFFDDSDTALADSTHSMEVRARRNDLGRKAACDSTGRANQGIYEAVSRRTSSHRHLLRAKSTLSGMRDQFALGIESRDRRIRRSLSTQRSAHIDTDRPSGEVSRLCSRSLLSPLSPISGDANQIWPTYNAYPG
jgi:hypothetical protein